MERIEKMLRWIEEDINEVVDNHKQWLENGEFVKVQDIFQWISKELKPLEKSCLVISFLRSSYITKSHKFKFTVYDGEPFMERNPPYQMVSLSLLYQEADRELERLIKRAKEKFVNITNMENELIRQVLMEKLYESSKILFKSIIERNTEDKGGIKVFFGEEMGDIQEIGEL